MRLWVQSPAPQTEKAPEGTQGKDTGSQCQSPTPGGTGIPPQVLSVEAGETGARRRDTAGLLMTKQATFPSVYLQSHQSNFPDTLLCSFFSILVSTPEHFLWELWTLPVILSEGFPWLLKYKGPMYQKDVPCETRAHICRDIHLII